MTMKVSTTYMASCSLCGFIKTFERLKDAKAFAASHDCQSYQHAWTLTNNRPTSTDNQKETPT